MCKYRLECSAIMKKEYVTPTIKIRMFTDNQICSGSDFVKGYDDYNPMINDANKRQQQFTELGTIIQYKF